MEEGIFEIKLDGHGSAVLRRLYSRARFFYGCTLVTLVFDFINAYMAYKSYSKFGSGYPELLKFQTVINISFLIIYAVLLAASGYFLYRFATRSREAIQFNDSHSFNRSFDWLLQQTTIACILFALNSIWAIMNTYSEIKLSALYSQAG